MDVIGKEVIIKVGMYKGEWGIIKGYDGECYHVALWNGNEQLIFERNEIRIRRGN